MRKFDDIVVLRISVRIRCKAHARANPASNVAHAALKNGVMMCKASRKEGRKSVRPMQVAQPMRDLYRTGR